MHAGFFGVLGFDERFEIGEVHLPEAAILLEPGVDGAKRLGIELVDAVTAFAMLAYEVSTAKQAKVLRDGRARDGKNAGDAAGWLATLAEKVEDSSARGIGERLEGDFCRICNRSVPHNA